MLHSQILTLQIWGPRCPLHRHKWIPFTGALGLKKIFFFYGFLPYLFHCLNYSGIFRTRDLVHSFILEMSNIFYQNGGRWPFWIATRKKVLWEKVVSFYISETVHPRNPKRVPIIEDRTKDEQVFFGFHVWLLILRWWPFWIISHIFTMLSTWDESATRSQRPYAWEPPNQCQTLGIGLQMNFGFWCLTSDFALVAILNNWAHFHYVNPFTLKVPGRPDIYTNILPSTALIKKYLKKLCSVEQQ